MEPIVFELEAVYREIKQRQSASASYEESQLSELIDEVLDEQRTDGKLPDDFDFKAAREKLEYMLKTGGG